jgi:hypothetical protein
MQLDGPTGVLGVLLVQQQLHGGTQGLLNFTSPLEVAPNTWIDGAVVKRVGEIGSIFQSRANTPPAVSIPQYRDDSLLSYQLVALEISTASIGSPNSSV